MRRPLLLVLPLAAYGCGADFNTPDPIPLPPNGVGLAVDFCSTDLPNWFAIRNEGGPWIVSRDEQQRYPATVTPKVTVVYGRSFDDLIRPSEITVLYLTAAELQQAICGPLLGTKTLHANISGATNDDVVIAAMSAGSGRAPAAVGAPVSQVHIENVLPGARDLLAYLRTPGNRPKYILRGEIDAPANTLLPVLDFNSAAATLTGRYPLTVSEAVDGTVYATFASVLGTQHELGATSITGGSAEYVALPPAALRPGDLHRQTAAASDGRHVSTYLSSPGQLSLTLGPPMATPTIAKVQSVPVLRMRATFPRQAEYPDFASAAFYQGNLHQRYVRVIVSAAYLDGDPAEWSIEIPELPFLANSNQLTDGLTTQWKVEAWNSTAGLLFGHVGATNNAMTRCAMSVSANSLMAKGCRSPLVMFPRPTPLEQ